MTAAAAPTTEPSTTERERRRAERDTARVASFSDAVFAIAATLLVLDLNVSELGEVLTNDDLLNALATLGTTFVGVVVSFLILCLMWWTHVRILEDVELVDATFVALDSVRLLFVVLIPFTTSLMSSYAELELGDIALALNVLAIVVVGCVQSWYATRPGSPIAPGLTVAERTGARREALSALIVATAVVLLAPFLGPIAFILFAFDPLVTRALTRRPGRAGVSTP